MNSLLARLQQLAEASPGHPVLESNYGQISVIELLVRIQELSLELQAMNISVLGLFCENSVDWVTADLASQFEGLCLVPIPTFFSDIQVRYVVESAALDALLYDTGSASRVAFLFGENESTTVQVASRLLCRRMSPQCPAIMPATTSKLTFTSGTTGNPKGVCLSSTQCLTVATSVQKAIAIKAPRHLCVLPLSTLLENIGGVYMPILSGGTSVVYPVAAMGMDGSSQVRPQVFLNAIERHRPHTMILVPQLLALIDAGLAQGWKAPDSLRFIAVGGGRVAQAVLARVRAAGLPVYEGYGLSECASVVSMNTDRYDRPGTSGRVLPHVQVTEVDGELQVSGNNFLGYLGEPDSWDANSVHTGDLGVVSEDGFVTVQGRHKNVLVSSYGRNISPEWVESELLAITEIQQALVLGDAQPHCSALIYPSSRAVTDAQVQSALDQVNQQLPDYAQILSWCRLDAPFTVSNGMLTENGRLRRDAIAGRLKTQINSLYSNPQESLAV